MTLARYSAEADGRAEELEELLGEPGVQWLRERLPTMTEDEAMSYLLGALPEVQDVLGATPARTLQVLRRSAKTVPTQRVLLWAAVFWARRASEMLQAVELQQLQPGLPYRETTVRAAAAWQSLTLTPSAWPFEEPEPAWKTEET